MFQDNALIVGRADAESNFIQNSEQYDVIFLIDNDVDERQRPAAATAARAHRGNYISARRSRCFAIAYYL